MSGEKTTWLDFETKEAIKEAKTWKVWMLGAAKFEPFVEQVVQPKVAQHKRGAGSQPLPTKRVRRIASK